MSATSKDTRPFNRMATSASRCADACRRFEMAMRALADATTRFAEASRGLAARYNAAVVKAGRS